MQYGVRRNIIPDALVA